MRILITNDDGINAEGIKVLERVARTLSDDVWVVAPETEQSGMSHSLTLNDPLRVREISPRHFAVSGTPTDCVIVGVRQVMPSMPDLVLSGINKGQNAADHVTYSGTIAGAMEGTLIGIPSIALSQAYPFDNKAGIRWETAEAHGPAVIRRLLEIGIPENVLMNVNFPDRPAGDDLPVAITHQGYRNPSQMGLEERQDGRGQSYFWMTFQGREMDIPQGSDIHALRDGAISVTPLTLDLTAHAELERLQAAW